MKNTLKYVILWVFFQWMQHLHCFRSAFFLTNRCKKSSSLNSISISLLGSKVPVKSNANITSAAILGRLAKLGGEKDSSSIYQKNYADLWDEVPADNLQPIDFGHMQWTRGKNYYQIPDTAMLHVALNPERNSRAIELFYEIVKDRGNFITGEGEFKAYNTSAAYLLSHFRNTMQYHFAAEICNYFLYHLNNGEVKWKEEDFVIENKIIDRNYIPDRIFPTTLNLFGLPEKLSIKFKRIEEETKYNLCQHCSPNFYFIQQVARFLGRNAERFISGATFAYAFTEDYLKPTEESALEELLKEECKSLWKNKYDAFEVRKEKKNGKEQIQLISIRDKYGYNRAHVYAVDPPKGVKNGITTISIVIAGSPNPLSSSNALKLWLGTNLGLNKRGASQKIAGKVVDCHAGIYRMFSQLYYGNKKNPGEMTIEKAVTKFIKGTINTNDIEIRVSGHSLGGAIAQMLALDFNCSKFDRVRELYCVTLNSPPVFTKVPQLKYPQKVQLVHFYHHYDPVVNVPKILFRNAGI